MYKHNEHNEHNEYNDHLQELFERNVILLEPIIRRKMKERQHMLSLLKNKSRSYLTRIDEEHEEKNETNDEKKRSKKI